MSKINQFSILILFLFFLSSNIKSQTKAITETGDTIYVYDNGTWSYEPLEIMPELDNSNFSTIEITFDTIKNEFTFPNNTNNKVKNSRDQFIIKYDDRIWKRVPPATLNEDAEFGFKCKKNDIWCIVISEETPIEPDGLFNIAINNIEDELGAKPKIIKSEIRTVNGNKIIRGVLGAKFSGIDFIFETYYFSNEKGAVQFSVWTSKTVWKKNHKVIQDLLNGFIVK